MSGACTLCTERSSSRQIFWQRPIAKYRTIVYIVLNWTPKVCKTIVLSHQKQPKRPFIYILLGSRHVAVNWSWALTCIEAAPKLSWFPAGGPSCQLQPSANQEPFCKGCTVKAWKAPISWSNIPNIAAVSDMNPTNPSSPVTHIMGCSFWVAIPQEPTTTIWVTGQPGKPQNYAGHDLSF